MEEFLTPDGNGAESSNTPWKWEQNCAVHYERDGLTL